jgi:hypothetical protein
MFDRFWQQYPQGSILSDLVQIHEDLYVVKVTLASGGQPLVATLAAADQVEAAESMARERALQILGCAEAGAALPSEEMPLPKDSVNGLPEIEPEPIPRPAPMPAPSVPAIDTQPSFSEPIEPENSVVAEPASTETFGEPLTSQEPDQLPVDPAPIDESVSLLSADLSMESLSSNGSIPAQLEMAAPALPAPEASPTPKVSEVSEESVAATPAKTRSKKAPAPPVESLPPATPSDDAAPLSVTDIIPLINMELKRLNWSREQGRDYMVSLYNKRASSLLSDEELFGLLQHLRDEPGEK